MPIATATGALGCDDESALGARDDGAGEDTDRAEPVMSLPMALFPYGVLTVVSIIGLAIGMMILVNTCHLVQPSR